jgi:radical SAM superfamily enzyme YgiQ (UPF0313 family)
VGQLPSLGLLTLAGHLTEEWTCSYHEATGDDDLLVQSIVQERPRLVAMSALTASVEHAYRVAARLRRENIITVLGGLHASACPGEAERHVDVVCAGEGELVWPDVLRDAIADRLRSRYNAVRLETELPWKLPRFDLVGDQPRPRWTLQTQRGCPLACEFCAASRTISRFREKPLDLLRAELTAISERTPKPIIELADDNTFAGTRDPEPLLAALAATGARYFTEVDWRIGQRPQLLGHLAASGCVQVLVGIESLVFRYPGMGAKQAELSRIMDAVDRIQGAGIAVNGCFIVGGDGETQSSIDRLIEFVRSTRLADVQLTLSTPFPGTPLRSRLARAGRMLSDRDWSHYTLFDVTFEPDMMSVAELERSYRQALAAVYDATEARRRTRIRHDVWRCNPCFHSERM